MATTVHDIDELTSLVGSHLGYSEWQTISQDQVNRFADATGDHQWIHVDPERAIRESPFGGPIAHGYLTLALAPVLVAEVLVIEQVAMAVNYGANKVRFPSPVPVGADVRMGAVLGAVEPVDGGAQVLLDLTFEVRDAPKPSCVAQVVYRFYR